MILVLKITQGYYLISAMVKTNAEHQKAYRWRKISDGSFKEKG